MTDEEEMTIRRAYAEAALAAREKGLSGVTATRAVLAAAAKVATRVLGRPVSPDEVDRLLHG